MDGILTCQSGVLLSEILEVFVPKGWFLPVTPGTKYITVGGAVVRCARKNPPRRRKFFPARY